MTTIDITPQIRQCVAKIKSESGAYAEVTHSLADAFPLPILAGTWLTDHEYYALPTKLQARVVHTTKVNIDDATVDIARLIQDNGGYGPRSRELAQLVLDQLPVPPKPYVITVTNPDGTVTGTFELTPDEAKEVSGTWHDGCDGSPFAKVRGNLAKALRA